MGETGSLSEAQGWEGAGRARLGPRPPPLAALAPPRDRGTGLGQLPRLWLPSLPCPIQVPAQSRLPPEHPASLSPVPVDEDVLE